MSDHSQKEFDIVVVGAGLVGSTAALALANVAPDLNIVVLDAGEASRVLADHCAATSVDDFDPRVVALTRDSQSLLQRVGAWQLVEAKRLCPYTDMQVWDAEGTARIAFNSSDIQEHNLGHIVENKLLVSALSECLAAEKNITLLHECCVNNIQSVNEMQELRLQHDSDTLATHVRTKLVFACDGALSPLRQMMQIATREWDYGHDAIVTTVETERAHQGVARQRFISTGPLAYLPLSIGGSGNSADEHFCSIVWSCIPERAEELMALDDREFSNALAAALEFELGDVKAVAKRFRIPLRQRHAREYIKPGFALAGDAAHTIHPLAGQGINLGLKDVAAFVEQIQYAVERDVPISHYSVLRRYQRQRMADNLTMMATMEGFKRLFGSKNISLRWLRNESMRSLDKVSMLKNKIVRLTLFCFKI